MSIFDGAIVLFYLSYCFFYSKGCIILTLSGFSTRDGCCAHTHAGRCYYHWLFSRSLDTLSQALHELREPVDLFPGVSLFVGVLMRAMDIITTTGLAAECVSWDDTGEARDSLVLSCCQLFLLSALKGLFLQGLHPGKTRRQQLLLLALLLDRGLLRIVGRRLSLPPLTLHRGH